MDKVYEILDVLCLEDLVYTHGFFEILSDSIDEFHQGDRITSDGVEIENSLFFFSEHIKTIGCTKNFNSLLLFLFYSWFLYGLALFFIRNHDWFFLKR